MTVLRVSPGWVRTTNICVKEQCGKGERHRSKREASPYRRWAKPTKGDTRKPRAKPAAICRIPVTGGGTRGYEKRDKMADGMT